MTRVRNASVLAVLAVVVTIVGTMDTSRASVVHSQFSIHGTYRLTYTGLHIPSFAPESGVGIFVADGTGNIAGTEVFNVGGRVCNVTVTATYTVNGNGTGTLSGNFTSPTPGCSGQFNSSLLIYEGGDAVKAVSIDPGFVTLSEEWRRQQ